jgi:NitT/TauT family transport system ATP-binding protein
MEFINTSLPDIIELKNIRQSYDGGVTNIIEDFNLLVEDHPGKGQFIVLLGASGCGKSTILRYISGLQKPTSGEILIKGKPITPDDRVSMVFQQYSSFPWLTVLENVALGLEYRGVPKKQRTEQAMAMIDVVGLLGHEKKYAKHPILSGGQLQRVAIARSLVTNQEVLLMDEPFGALDVNTRLKMQDFLIDIWTKVHPTIILVTHDISEAVYLGDDIFIMSARPGKLAHHIKVNLPSPRNKEIKRTPQFIETVNQIEDLMVQLHQ